MANERKVTESAAEIKNGNLIVTREPILDKNGKQKKTEDGRAYYFYLVHGKVRGRDVKVDFEPKDKGGYEPLDIVFDVSPKAELIMKEEEITSDKTGKTSFYTSYKVYTEDENGIPFECGVKPSRDSDKSLLLMLLRTVEFSQKVAE